MSPLFNSRAPEIPESLSKEEKSALLQIARQSLVETIVHGRRWQPDEPAGILAERRGAFVTLELRGKLRGCVGQLEPHKSLAFTVARCAISAAREDDRFNPVQADEVPQVTIEISVLSPAKQIAPNEIQIGVHGLIVERGPFRGLLLPQVATGRNWTAEKFLSETCLKAGLPSDAWKSTETQIFGFSAEVFSEAESGQSLRAD
jgi:AmmeMemoRadiSam system protein A